MNLSESAEALVKKEGYVISAGWVEGKQPEECYAARTGLTTSSLNSEVIGYTHSTIVHLCPVFFSSRGIDTYAQNQRYMPRDFYYSPFNFSTSPTSSYHSRLEGTVSDSLEFSTVFSPSFRSMLP